MATYFNTPVGGTTGLPQYLQQKQSQQQQQAPAQQPQVGSGGTAPANQTAAPATKSPTQSAFGAGAGGAAPPQPAPKPAVAPAPQPVGPVSSTGNPTIPAAPAAQPPVTAAPGGTPLTEQAPQAPAAGGQQPFDFGGWLQQQLTGGSQRYSSDLVQSLRDSMNADIDAQGRKAQDQLVADASARGVYHGTPLTNSEGDLAQAMQRMRIAGNNDLLTKIADANAADRQNAVGNMFTFGNGQLNQQQLQAYILQMLATQGAAGGPTIPGAVGDFGDLPAPSAPDYSAIYQMLGGLYGKPAQPAGATK